ncbi:hypothetical protein [Agrobacterium larrymoorei]|uniref:Uncharacterized protein n=1 Tax=Agrobacterium larrymoorei TaxID=160699 RepID=A0A4D7DM11_9HYPH|nr:hypothetical protein [Agrobacterium larrymoorei]QCI96967.1 hypothetical protein CFBP5473_02975 [Agrobacterium larrymoorei]QYA07607.1 hypothetical protein J5285_02420 [Agrobacterium larrymoorei]
MLPAALLAAAIATAPTQVNKLVLEEKDFRMQTIRKAQGEVNWPFVASEGILLCAPVIGDKAVYFVGTKEDGGQEEPVILSVNPMMMSIINMGKARIFRDFTTIDELMGRLYPYITMGKRLCDQPAGAIVPESSL